MSYGKKIIIKWNPRLHVLLIAITVLIFAIGMACGFNIGKGLVITNARTTAIKIPTPTETTMTPPSTPLTEITSPTEFQYDYPQLKSIGEFTVTAYCPCNKCCGKTDGITASGTKAMAGRTIAADTSILPFGTEIYISGDRYIVEDTGGAVKGNKIDIFFDNHEEALQFGKQQIEIFVEAMYGEG